MPALITHHLFGEQAASKLPAGTIAEQDELDAFLLGCQGPDPLFFYWSRPTSFSTVSRLGSTMHATNMSAYFDTLRAATRGIPAKDRQLAEAFSLGLLAHYALDRAAHPFIYGQQYAIQRAKVGLERDGSQVHAFIESELDSFMLWRVRQETVTECPPAGFLNRPPRVDLVAGSLFSRVANEVYDVRISAKTYGISVSDMQRLYRMIEPQGSKGSLRLGGLERAVRKGGQSLFYALSHPVLNSESTPFANLERAEWIDVWTNEPCTDSFVDRFDTALAGYGDLAGAYVDGVPGTDLTGGVSYGGLRMADESESVPLPEV